MKILSIDPGTEHSAWTHLDGYTITDKGIESNYDLLHRLELIKTDMLCIEMIASYGMPVGREVFETVVWIGRFIQVWNGRYELIYRRDIKHHFCNSTKAKDANIRQVLLDKLGKEGTKGVVKDIWQALAVGVYAQDTFI